MAAKKTGLYYVSKTGTGFQDIVTLFPYVQVLSVTGLLTKGEPVNIYNEQWVDSQEEDFLIAHENNTIIRKNPDIEITFVVSLRYGGSSSAELTSLYDTFVNYMTESAIYIKSNYVKRSVYCVCNKMVEPENIKLQRGTQGSFILGKITLHALNSPSVVS